MFLFDLGHLAYMVIVSLTEAMFMPVAAIPPMGLHQVAAVEYKIESYHWSNTYDCRFYGITVPIERDWEEVASEAGSVRPPELGKIYVYAMMVNKKTCPGKADEYVYLEGDSFPSGINDGVYATRFIPFKQPKAGEQVKWQAQAIKVIKASAASGNEAASNFLADQEKVAKNISPALFSEQPTLTQTAPN